MLLTVFGLGTVSVRSQAAGPDGKADAPAALPSTHAQELQLLPVLAKRDVGPLFGSFSKPTGSPLFGSFIKPAGTSEALPTDTACPPDQVEVEGDYCPYVEEKCLRWLDPATHLQCAEFEKTPSSGHCAMKTQHKKFCIDRYEWPNKVGAIPVYMASWYDAKQSCEAIGKRLCNDEEWTLACEGPDLRPYPYGDGYTRDPAACNIDKPYIWPHPEKVYDPKTSADELARLDQREPSGSRTSCVSPYGVHDMTGNVDEWVLNVSQGGKPFQSGLKGGYWGPVRTRCRPMTTAHNESFRYYQIGFRCCGNPHATEVGGEAPLANK